MTEWGSRKSSIKISSFQQQVEYLLTSRERSMLKKALQLYSDNRYKLVLILQCYNWTHA